jgi:predicted transcriptional regulator
MSTRDELRRILTIISDLTHNDTNSTVKDTLITTKANVPFKEIGQYLSELQSAGLIVQDRFKPANVDYRMYKITRKGINEIYNKEFR